MSFISNKLTAVFVISGSLLMAGCGAGGSNASPTASTTVVTDRWSVKTSDHGLGTINNPKLVTMANGDLYVLATKQVGNNYTVVFSRSTDGGVTWTLRTSPSFTSLYGAAIASNGTSILLTGGRTSDASINLGAAMTYNNDVYSYNTATNTWTKIATAPFTAHSTVAAKEGHAMAFNGAGSFYVTGGGCCVNGVSALVFESQNNGVTWSKKTNGSGDTSQYVLENHCLAANNTTLYSMGGSGGGSANTTTYNTNLTSTLRSTDGGITWAVTSSNMPDTPQIAACAQINGTIYSTGGLSSATGGNIISNLIRKSTDGGASWLVDTTSTNHGYRMGHSMAVRNGKLIVFGGFTANASGAVVARTDVIEGSL